MSFRTLIFSLGVLLLFSNIASAGDLVLKWTYAATTCADESPIANCPVTGFEIQEKDDSGIWLIKEGVAPTVFTKTYKDIPVGVTKCYRMRVNAGGAFSATSNEVCSRVTTAPKTVNLSVTVSVP
jgi:hypothetical protein